MAVIAVRGCAIDLTTTLVSGRSWWVCPIGGVRCGRVLTDLDAMGLDAMTRHLELAHLNAIGLWLLTRNAPEREVSGAGGESRTCLR